MPFFVLLAAAWIAALAAPASSATIVVPDSIPTVAGGLALAVAGDTVLVRAGTYFEHVVMVDGVHLVGEDDPVLDGSSSGVVITADACGNSTLVQGIHVRNGAGLGVGGGAALTSSSIVFFDCRFESNTAMHGGGIGGDASEVAVFACEFENNTALQSGGAISVTGSVSPTLSDCTFRSNAALVGGAIAVRNGSTPSIIRCLVEGNACDQGAIWYDFLTGGLLTQSTIVLNDTSGANGGSVFFNALASPSVMQNVFAFDVAGAATFSVAGASPSFGCNDAFGNVDGNALLGGFDVGGNFSADPRFCDMDASDFTLQSNSPCLPDETCSLVGAFGAGCGAVSAPAGVEVSSWGRIKARFRNAR